MTVVRELVTRLGFQVDRSGLNFAERAIQGFKNRVVFTASSIKDLILEAADYVGSVAKANIDIKDLARNTKLSVQEFVSLRRAAEDFRFDPNQFDESFQTLSKLLRDAKSGYGELFNIIRKSRSELDLTPFISQGDVKGAFVAILDYIKSLEDIGDKLAVIRDIFGPGNENGILRIVEAGSEAFLKAAESNKEYAKSFDEGLESQKEYLKNLNELLKIFEQVKQVAVNTITPIASFAVGGTTKGLKGGKLLKEKAETEGIGATLDFVGQAVADAVYRFLGQEPLIDVQNRLLEEDIEFQKRLGEYIKNQKTNAGPVTINNKVEVNVDPATDIQQRQAIAEAVRIEMESFTNEKVREVISNNPQVE
jgi:hypothetical protein